MHVALLRGINVGGNNIIKMVDLRAAFEDLGFSEVVTYIASGNVVFAAKDKDKSKLTKKIETALSDAFEYSSRVVIVSASELAAVIADAPAKFGKEPKTYRYDVLFVREPVKAKDVVGEIPSKAGVDTVTAGKHAIYFRRLIAKATQSHVSKLVQKPVYKDITIRNWNTTTKLFEMVQGG